MLAYNPSAPNWASAAGIHPWPAGAPAHGLWAALRARGDCAEFDDPNRLSDIILNCPFAVGVQPPGAGPAARIASRDSR